MSFLNHTLFLKKLPLWLLRIGAFFYIDYKFPRHIFIETTTRCNLNCWYCPRPKIEKDMKWQIFKKIINEAKQYGARSFSLHLFGEPLLDKTLLKKINYIKSANKRNNIILTTNGTIRNPEIYDKVDKIIITHNANYRLNDFKRWQRKIMWRCYDNSEFPEGWQVERRALHNYGGNVEIRNTIHNNKRYSCYHLWLAPAIAWNGDILMCCCDVKHKVKLGNIKDMTLREAWHSTKLEAMRATHKLGMYSNICYKCNTWRNYPNIC